MHKLHAPINIYNLCRTLLYVAAACIFVRYGVGILTPDIEEAGLVAPSKYNSTAESSGISWRNGSRCKPPCTCFVYCKTGKRNCKQPSTFATINEYSAPNLFTTLICTG